MDNSESNYNVWYYQNIVMPDLFQDSPLHNDFTVYIGLSDGTHWIRLEDGTILFLN